MWGTLQDGPSGFFNNFIAKENKRKTEPRE